MWLATLLSGRVAPQCLDPGSSPRAVQPAAALLKQQKEREAYHKALTKELWAAEAQRKVR